MSRRLPNMNCGDGTVRADNGCVARGPFAKTASVALTALDTGSMFTNLGAAGAVTLSLPAAKAGLWFMALVVTAQSFGFQATGGAKINNSAANGTYIAAGTQAGVGTVELFSDGTNWFVFGTGTWVTT